MDWNFIREYKVFPQRREGGAKQVKGKWIQKCGGERVKQDRSRVATANKKISGGLVGVPTWSPALPTQ